MGGQQPKASAQINGESYPEKIPLEILQLEKCLENGNFTKVQPSSQDGKSYQYLIRSQQSTHLAFGISFTSGDNSEGLSGPVQIYRIQNSSKNKSQALCFEGELLNGKRKGYGIEYDKKGDIFYQGFFNSNKYHGWGITDSYEGQWATGTKCGYGKYKSNYPIPDKNINFTYEGNWKNDKFDGLGAKNIKLSQSEQFVSPNYSSNREYEIDEQYIGEWLEGVKFGCGKSIKYFLNTNPVKRQVYEGEFARNKYQGRGKLVNAQGQVQQGKFDQGNYVGPL